ncbi:MAG: hypothetical protein HY216_13250 [Candidatus Rokubacteria bacterium]|nr:hypothetical protein [Candidatus Rokubacteria bacterium]
MGKSRLWWIVFQDGDWLVAHCLEYDFATLAKTLPELRYAIELMVVGHVAICLEHGLKPFSKRRRAPAKYWALFRQSKIPLPTEKCHLIPRKRGVPIPIPEIRIAALPFPERTDK